MSKIINIRFLWERLLTDQMSFIVKTCCLVSMFTWKRHLKFPLSLSFFFFPKVRRDYSERVNFVRCLFNQKWLLMFFLVNSQCFLRLGNLTREFYKKTKEGQCHSPTCSFSQTNKNICLLNWTTKKNFRSK